MNNNPTATGITNFISTGVQTGPNDIQLCQGDNVCFDVEFTDINALDSIYLVSNVGTLFPGATFTQNSYSSPASATICFIVGPQLEKLNPPPVNPLSAMTCVKRIFGVVEQMSDEYTFEQFFEGWFLGAKMEDIREDNIIYNR